MQSGYMHLTEYPSGQVLNTREKKHFCQTAVRQKWRFIAPQKHLWYTTP